jgi:hypothetical protein
MGEVWLAEQTRQMRQQVALKIVKLGTPLRGSPLDRQESMATVRSAIVSAVFDNMVADPPAPVRRAYYNALERRDGRRANNSTSSLCSVFELVCADMTLVELRRLARLGAEARLGALQQEISDIYATFPELRRGRSAPDLTDAVRQVRQGAVMPRRRRKMSREARKRIAEAQRKRWAEWKAKQRKTEERAGVVPSGAVGSRKRK